MPRHFTAAVAVAFLPLAAAAADPPTKPERIVVNDPEKLKEDVDFAVQGEYEGEVSFGGQAAKVGIQLVARGSGQFFGRSYHGGLPGAGWDGRSVVAGTAERDGNRVVLKDDKGNPVGELADGVVTLKGQAPGTLRKVERESPTLGAKPPAGAVVLFAAAGDEKKWDGGKLVELSDGTFLGVGEKTKQKFGAFTAHVEFRLPWMPNGTGQGRGNSGVYVQDRYEIQVLDSFGLKGENNECGGVYTQYKPLVNMCLPPMRWQTYDIDFTPAAFDLPWVFRFLPYRTKPARLTVKHNGVTIHDNVELKGPTGGGQPERPTPGPIQLQNHGDPVVYRNVWVVETK